MNYAKISRDIVSGERPLTGLVVSSPSAYCAHCFGEGRYDEGELEGFQLVGVDLKVSRPAGFEQLASVARELGIDVDDETTSTMLLGEEDVVAALERQGYDGFADDEVIGNAEYRVEMTWKPELVTILKDPAGVPDFSIREAQDGALLISVDTLAGRDRIFTAVKDAMDKGVDDRSVVLAMFLQGTGYRIEGAAVVDAAGHVWEPRRVYPLTLVDDGYAEMQPAVPTLSMMR